MLHNKYYEILKPVLGDYSIELMGRDIAKKISLSHKSIANALNALEYMGILKSRFRGNQKIFTLNKKNIEVKDNLIILEIYRKLKLLQKYPLFSELFSETSGIVGVFGSYAKNSQKQDSDLDVFVIGKKHNYLSKASVFDISVDCKFFSEKEYKFLLKQNNPLVLEISKNHVLMSGFEKFVHIQWSHSNGVKI